MNKRLFIKVFVLVLCLSPSREQSRAVGMQLKGYIAVQDVSATLSVLLRRGERLPFKTLVITSGKASTVCTDRQHRRSTASVAGCRFAAARCFTGGFRLNNTTVTPP